MGDDRQSNEGDYSDLIFISEEINFDEQLCQNELFTYTDAATEL